MNSSTTFLKNIACCVQVIDLGTQSLQSAGKLAHRREILFAWELVDPTIDSALKSTVVYKCYEMNLGLDSSLRKDLERILSNQNPDWFKRLTPKSLLGKYCVVRLAGQLENLSSTYVTRVKALEREMDQSTLPKPKTPFGIFMISEPDMEFFNQLPKDIQEKIKLSPEFAWAQKALSDDEYE